MAPLFFYRIRTHPRQKVLVLAYVIRVNFRLMNLMSGQSVRSRSFTSDRILFLKSFCFEVGINRV